MDNIVSWILLDFFAFYLGIRFAIYVIDQYEARQKEMRENDKW